MGVYYNHDVYQVSSSKKVPYRQYIVRPHAPAGKPGVYAQCKTFSEAFKLVEKWKPEDGVVDMRRRQHA